MNVRKNCHLKSKLAILFVVTVLISQSSCQENRRFQVFESNTEKGLIYIVDHENNEITSTYFTPVMDGGVVKSSLIQIKKKEKVDNSSRFTE